MVTTITTTARAASSPSIRLIAAQGLDGNVRRSDTPIVGRERELAAPGNFISNFEPLGRPEAQALVDEAIGFSKYTAPMQKLVRAAAAAEQAQLDAAEAEAAAEVLLPMEHLEPLRALMASDSSAVRDAASWALAQFGA